MYCVGECLHCIDNSPIHTTVTLLHDVNLVMTHVTYNISNILSAIQNIVLLIVVCMATVTNR